MGLSPGHTPRQPSVGTEEGITFLVRGKLLSDGADTHHEARSSGREDGPKIVRVGDGMQVQ